MDGPGELILAYGPLISNPGLNIHLLIEFEKALAEAVTHYNPAEVVISRLKAISEVGNTKLEFLSLTGSSLLVICLLVSAAAGQEADGHGGNETCSYEFFPEFHLIHPSVKIYFNKNWTQS